MTNEILVEKIRGGYSVTDNMQLLYERNLPLIRKFIKSYAVFECMDDLMQEAYFGLWEAVQHYESSENVLFMTYAEYWIKQSARRYIQKCGSCVKISSGMIWKINRYRKTVCDLEQRIGRKPTMQEIAESMGMDCAEVTKLSMYSVDIVSLDAPINDDGNTTLCECLKGKYNTENKCVDKLYDKWEKSELWAIVRRNTMELENRIIKEYYEGNKTFEQIADLEEISVSKVRYLRDRGLQRLRRGKARRELLDKLEVVDRGIYRNNLTSFKQHNFTSTVEHIAIQRAEIKACL